ncbi:LLM class flavin-dependent oxidoreductase [Streptomyces sp. AK02-01A]|uniref:LLM class flavin-dependent oxidoreductase n=1 Tax=Streptomyces sp. AK02-01A TaxID=3028648 RepID=UPI0029BC7751|nr:LLM class flavin-dependent oxidoreductase [Streptomyces sp. AK02-01A]MDX3855203.1 LLM class flavin-dependent oxidoreductase [Streptomyces sp. AK02-01A]
MRIGIAIPNTTPGTNGPLVLDWARRAEERGFAFVSTIGRVPYPSYDSLTALAAVGAATSRIGLLTNAVLGPTYPDAVLAKITATVAQLSGDRLTLGLGVGARESDYRASERDFAGRGAVFDRQLAYLRRAWQGEAVEEGDFPGERRAVAPTGKPVPVLIGGHGTRAVRRTARWGAGWTGAGGGPRRAEPMVGEVLDAWRRAGRDGEPRLLGLAYFCADAKFTDESDSYVRQYYAYAGDHADTIAEGVVRTPERIRGIVEEFAAIGMNELTFTPTVARLDEVDRLADLVL